MKNVLSKLFFASLLCFCAPLFTIDLKTKIASEAAILMDADTLEVLYQKNAFKEYHPASIVKLPTALFALKEQRHQLTSMLKADLDCIGSISDAKSKKMNYKHPAHWMVLGATHIGIHQEEVLSFKDLLYGMLLVSAGDASNIIAKRTSGTIQQFVRDLNQYVKKLGCKKTVFKNPHGLFYPNQSTTAYDMALIGREVFNEPVLKDVLKTRHYKLSKTNKHDARWIKNHNKLIQTKSKFFYPYALGGKTGFHSNAKCTFIALAEKKGRKLVVVLLKCPSGNQRFEDTIKLFEAGFKHLEKKAHK